MAHAERTWDVAWIVGTHAKTWDASWRVGVDHAERTWSAMWLVLAEPVHASRSWDLAWRVLASAESTFDVAWLVKDTDPGERAFDVAWIVGGRFERAFSFTWKVARRSHIVVPPGPDPTPVEVIDDVAPYAAVNGIAVYVPEDWTPGGEDPQGDLIVHHDGSLVLHDPIPRSLYDLPVPVRVKATSHADLDAQEEAIRGACFAGGTFVWQSIGKAGDEGPLKTYSFAPSPKPGFRRDKIRESLHRSYGTLVLRVWPS